MKLMLWLNNSEASKQVEHKLNRENRVCPVHRHMVIIITLARLRQAAGKSDAVNRVRFLYICRALGQVIGSAILYGVIIE